MVGVEQFIRDPKWWADPCWEEVVYQREYGLSLEEIRGAVDILRQLFDERWTQSALRGPLPNVVLAILYGGQGLWSFKDIMWLGRIALAVARIPGVAGRLSDLCGPKSRATLFELEVASWLIETGWDVEFVKPYRIERHPI